MAPFVWGSSDLASALRGWPSSLGRCERVLASTTLHVIYIFFIRGLWCWFGPLLIFPWGHVGSGAHHNVAHHILNLFKALESLGIVLWQERGDPVQQEICWDQILHQSGIDGISFELDHLDLVVGFHPLKCRSSWTHRLLVSESPSSSNEGWSLCSSLIMNKAKTMRTRHPNLGSCSHRSLIDIWAPLVAPFRIYDLLNLEPSV